MGVDNFQLASTRGNIFYKVYDIPIYPKTERAMKKDEQKRLLLDDGWKQVGTSLKDLKL